MSKWTRSTFLSAYLLKKNNKGDPVGRYDQHLSSNDGQNNGIKEDTWLKVYSTKEGIFSY